MRAFALIILILLCFVMIEGGFPRPRGLRSLRSHHCRAFHGKIGHQEGGQVDLERREARFADGERCELTEKEAELLRYLAMNAGRAIDRDELLANVWRISPDGISTRTIDMHVARLREKLRDTETEPRVLLTVRGKGYMYAGSVPTNIAASSKT